ncbi:MAG: Glucose/arabinose dehydrogenase, beta-propeller fold [Verrucomicrobia bacterium]|nr:MAG: Glucose/arabinose dehydrogenase, beta-propeller fold [Verrucomicrobiota bacterium]
MSAWSFPVGVNGSWILVFGVAMAAGAAETVPQSSHRPVVINQRIDAPAPRADLPDGFVLGVAAAPPLVTHPVMGCLDDRGRLFIGDAVGVNWNKAELEADPPNRVLLLEDGDGDGTYEKSTIFADRLTFPQGGQWLDGSLYVGSPPGIWKFTDKDGDGVAEERKMIVSGFDYTGNAADVHGPFLHPNGRLYWCHGRKGYRVTDSLGKVTHEGASSGIWSALPDGTDVRWHSLLAGDNPVEVDFTPDGELIGVQNIYYSQPRGDTLVHWLSGGVYERADMMKVLQGLPRTLERMPVIHNFGHVAVSGCCFWKSFEPSVAEGALHFLVTHFNTQRLVRMELMPEGSTFRARENEFLKIHDPDVHLTDVIEAGDGSLLVLNTGGWFRIGCPSSLMAKPDILGSVYRIRRSRPAAPGFREAWRAAWKAPGDSPETWLAGLADASPRVRLRTLAALAQSGRPDEGVTRRILELLGEPCDEPLEHALLFAARQWRIVDDAEVVRAGSSPLAQRRLLAAFQSEDPAQRKAVQEIARGHLDSSDPALARAAVKMAGSDPETVRLVLGWLKERNVSAARLAVIRGLGDAGGDEILTAMLSHPAPEVQRSAWESLAGRQSVMPNEAWGTALETALVESKSPGPSPVLLSAIKKVKSARFDAPLQAIANDPGRASALRLKALDAMQSRKLTPETFALLLESLSKDLSPAARIQAATMLGQGGLGAEQLGLLVPLFASVGPIELRELLPLARTVRDPGIARAMAVELAKNPVLGAQQESVYRTIFSAQSPELIEGIILPALRSVEAGLDARKRSLGPLAEKVMAQGNASAGRAHLASGKGSCTACHKIGETGRAIGPDLSKIGAIRTERDLLESILFPSNTLARDYEAHVIETTKGQTVAGVIRSHTAEGLLLVDASGQEVNVAHDQILSNTVLSVSLMPMGLDATLSEQELLDIVACLRSLR